ncbi:MAG: translation elongation factor Ts [Aerococcus sp.]|nr:translation elongation factor Ts [Aerococcus sp.]
MAISAKLVKELRDRTGAGMMDAKKALEAVDGDIDKAIDFLRENGQIKAAKKADRIAAEGLAKVVIDGDKAVILEVNSETDFVAKNEKFQTMLDTIAHALLEQMPKDLDSALKEVTVDGDSLEAYINAQIAVIGERLVLRRFAIFEKAADESFGEYIHMGGSVATLVQVKTDKEDVARNIALHVGGIAPQYVSEDAVPSDVRDHEREVLTQETLNEGKPEKIVDKIVDGRMHKFYSQIVLVDQDFLLDDSKTVGEYLKEQGAEAIDFRRYKVGEGLEKRNEDFAAEVQAEMNKN